MKKSISLILAIVFVISIMALPASAAGENRTAYGKGRNSILQNIGADDYSVLHQDLNDIAERTIMISTETQSSGAVVTT